MEPEDKQNLLSNQYCLPTFGLEYPSPGQRSSPLVQFYRPVEVLSNGESSLSNGHKATEVTAALDHQELWKELMAVGNEMIITTMGRYSSQDVGYCRR